METVTVIYYEWALHLVAMVSEKEGLATVDELLDYLEENSEEQFKILHRVRR